MGDRRVTNCASNAAENIGQYMFHALLGQNKSEESTKTTAPNLEARLSPLYI